MSVHDANRLTFTFCRKCKKLRSCLYSTTDSYICKSCASEKELIQICASCGRECLKNKLENQGGYCGHCVNDNIVECDLCGNEVYKNKCSNGVCNSCEEGINQPCSNCGDYIKSEKLSSDKLCEKCSIKIHKKLKESEVNEVVECLECGREAYVNDLNNKGVCIYCHCEELQTEIKQLRSKKKKAYI